MRFALLFIGWMMSVSAVAQTSTPVPATTPVVATPAAPVPPPVVTPAQPRPSPAKPQPPKSCRRATCRVWVLINKAEQTMVVYMNGKPTAKWDVSTGRGRRHETPIMERHPNGRLHRAYNSQEYPGGGDYEGLGNMPYSVFLVGGIAIHGTPERYWRRLGRTASHGCIRLHPDNARTFFNLVLKVGVKNVWVSIIDGEDEDESDDD